MNPVLETLKEARRLLAIHWIQGFSNVDDGYCLSEAVWHAAKTLGTSNGRARNRLYEVIPGSIVGFNDTPGRTQAEILEVVDKAIANESTR